MEIPNTRTVTIFTEPGKTKEQTLAEYKKSHAISNKDINEGKVKITVLDSDELFNPYSKRNLNKNK